MLIVPTAATTAAQMPPLSPIFDQVEDQWKLRNEILHGRDRGEQSLFHRAIICAKATRLYDFAAPSYHARSPLF
jgi:hypothetical protein